MKYIKYEELAIKIYNCIKSGKYKSIKHVCGDCDINREEFNKLDWKFLFNAWKQQLLVYSNNSVIDENTLLVTAIQFASPSLVKSILELGVKLIQIFYYFLFGILFGHFLQYYD